MKNSFGKPKAYYVLKTGLKRILSTGGIIPNKRFTVLNFSQIYTQYAQGYPQKTSAFSSKNMENSNFLQQNALFYHGYTQPVDKSCV